MAQSSSVLDSYNVAIAVGDLSTAVAAAVGMQVIAGGLSTSRLPRDILEIGGAAVIACQVADVVYPRLGANLESAFDKIQGFSGGKLVSKDTETALMRGAVAGAVGYGLFYVAGMTQGAAILSLQSALPAGVIGAACFAGHKASAMYMERQVVKEAQKTA